MTQKVGGVEFDVDVDVSGVKSASSKVQSDLSKVESSFNQVDSAAVRTANTMTSSSAKGAKGLSNLRGAAGQLGFQVQDMAVQAQMGTNALVILGQQGSQIAGIFGPTGAIVGGVIAVGAAIASVMVPSMMDGGDATEDLTEKLKELSKTNELTINQQKFLKQVEAEETKEKEKKIAKLKEERDELLATAQNGDWYQQTMLAASAANQGFVSYIASKLLPTMTDEQKKLVEINAELDTLAGKTGGEKFDADANKKAIMSYRDRIVAIQASMDQESAIVSNSLKYRAAVEEGIWSEQEAARRENLENSIVNEKAAFANRLAMLNEQRESILANDDLTETQRNELMSQFRVMEAQARYTHQQKLTDIDQDAADKRNQIAESEMQQKLSMASAVFGNLSSLMNTESKKMFEIGKAAATAGAIIDGIAAVQGAYKAGSKIGGPALGAAFAATAAVATLANIKQIQATQFGQKGTGQSYRGGQVVNNVSSTQQQQSQPEQRNISIALTGSGFSGGDIRGLISAINEELGDGVNLSATGG